MNDNIDKYISLSEENLLDLIKNNQNEAFKFLFQKYYSRLLGYAIRFVQEKEIAEDIIQEVFISFWEKRHLEINIIKFTIILHGAKCQY